MLLPVLSCNTSLVYLKVPIAISLVLVIDRRWDSRKSVKEETEGDGDGREDCQVSRTVVSTK